MLFADELTSDENMARANSRGLPKCMEGSLRAFPQKKKKEGPAIGSSSGERPTEVVSSTPAVGSISVERAVKISSPPAVRSSPVGMPTTIASLLSTLSLDELAPTTSYLYRSRLAHEELEREEKKKKLANKKAKYAEKKGKRHRMAPRDLPEDDLEIPSPTQPALKKQ